MTDELVKELHRLNEEFELVNRRYSEIQSKRLQVMDEIKLKQIDDISDQIPVYEKKLQYVKKCVGDSEKDPWYYTRVIYEFEKIDDSERMECDPLLLKISECLEDGGIILKIVFEYTNDLVRFFAERWMKENLPDAKNYSRE
jgi:hypothetical protein